MDIFSMFFPKKKLRKSGEKSSGTAPVSPENIEKKFENCGDLQRRELWPGGRKDACVLLYWLDGLCSGSDIAKLVIAPLCSPLLADSPDPGSCRELLSRGGVTASSMELRDELDGLCGDLTAGCCAIVFPRLGQALCFEVKSGEKRSVGQPSVEKTVKGAKDSFVETLRTNTCLVRRRLPSPELKLIQLKAGQVPASVAVMYMDGLADRKALDELLRRLSSMELSCLLSAGALEQRITSYPFSPFPQLLHTERPDIFAAQLMSGRIGILVDGLPLGFALPASLGQFMRVGEDKAQHFIAASALMLLRWLSMAITVLLPGLFVAVAMYHQEMIPLRLLSSMISAKQDVPFSVALEVSGMLLAFELLQEAGVRLPDPVGDTVSIIGALIVGQSAVEAKVVSPVAVIVVATAGICGFTQPSQDLSAALRIVRFILVLLAIALGMYGLMLGVVLLVLHLCSLESFGVSYTAPLSEGGFMRSLGSFLQMPLWNRKYRAPDIKSGKESSKQ